MTTWNCGMMTSLSGEWRTPQQLYEMLDREFHFTTDLACTLGNSLATPGHGIYHDSLNADWAGIVGPLWCNPPYGRQIGDWIEKAYRESRSTAGTTIVMLLPARTDTKWFHDYILGKAEIRFIRGRVEFEGDGKAPGGRCPFPSMVVVFRGNVEN
jgi:site-specific DNA-methyltransferase (adenine-specific)